MSLPERTPMSLFIDHITHAFNEWYKARYGEAKKPNAKVEGDIVDKFIRDVDGYSHMFHGIEDARTMEEAWEGMKDSLYGLTDQGIQPIQILPKKKGKDYDA